MYKHPQGFIQIRKVTVRDQGRAGHFPRSNGYHVGRPWFCNRVPRRYNYHQQIQEQHRENVRRVFSRIQEFGFKVKEEKCEFFLEEIKYLGHIIDKDSRRLDPDWAKAIKNMPVPGNITELQSFLGLANYYQSFIPNMHNLRAPLNALLKKDSTWKWIPECQEAFYKIKNTLMSGLSLAHYNPKSDIIMASDASSHGIGACILHKMPDASKKPVAHTSCPLLPSEKHYSQIEKEALAIIFAVTKFHRYLHGRFFKLRTDHKPLLTIFESKNRTNCIYSKQITKVVNHLT